MTSLLIATDRTHQRAQATPRQPSPVASKLPSALCASTVNERDQRMVQSWWAAGLALPALLLSRGTSSRGKPKGDAEDAISSRPDEGNDPSFICERVCTSDRLMRRMGGLSKDPTPNTCVTVCGISATDACEDACQRAVCGNMHQVPAWNDSCLKRCTSECLRGRAG